ncbi:hypothetical protein Plec18167_006161 [Paecilomyces lecythidis]|uniref:Uncharacterized protein n=1 Tax=Paecilomyces lecythidis TaxID=3004212 RepID=A0ABR3XDF8_9EURO
MATSTPNSAVQPPNETTGKTADGSGILQTGLPTPGASPEPEPIPDRSDNESDKKRRHAKLIKHIESSDPHKPFDLLGVKTVADLDSRVPRMKRYLEGLDDTDSRSALKKVELAEQKAKEMIEALDTQTQRIIDDSDSSYTVVLNLQESENPKEKADFLKACMKSSLNRHPKKEEAHEILERAESDADNAMDMDENDPLTPDNETQSLYHQASQTIHRMIRQFDTDDQIEAELDQINEEIEEHNRLFVAEERIDELGIQNADILDIIRPGKEDFRALEKDPSNKAARETLEKINQKLRDYNQKHFYPADWVLHLPQSNKLLQKMLGSNPVNTAIDVDCPQGSTLDGGEILRYIEYFVPSEEERKKGKEPRYSFVIWDTTGRYYLKTGKEVGDAARRLYLQQDDAKKIKISQYYGEMRHGVKYSKQYFNRLRTLKTQEGNSCLQFLGAARRSPMTKSGRTMPQEYCVIWIDDPDIGMGWFDVFRRSTWVNFFGNDANYRIDQYWMERQEDPSRRLALVDDRTSQNSSRSGKAGEKPSSKEEDSISKISNNNRSMDDAISTLFGHTTFLHNELTHIREMLESLTGIPKTDKDQGKRKKKRKETGKEQGEEN